ncbi:lanthionine synthetase C family protein [Streptomyces glomeratus]|uniref:Lanthionine synthetase C family protein n=1 Tax=Streptomyces glomeratus TaxID=284452 RepID=A0ABP6M7T2_9ACTN|nr:lanthionine synthetase C family protein [Streptomyces glomeratus]MCF1511378.1 lanthionine synthetase C family protein [Streptomyces glomeratus]
MTSHAAFQMAEEIANLLADPATAPVGSDTTTTHRQQLAYGPTGIALLHIERAARGLGPWQHAHAWVTAAARQPLTSGSDSHPFYGAPALAHAVACMAEHHDGPYQRALDTLDAQLTADVHRRVDAAHRRMDAGMLPKLSEFDAIRGLAGYGAYIIRRYPDSDAAHAVLGYCVRLTEPITDSGDVLPGWWVTSGPSGRRDERFPGGHANTGLAHGVGSVLALLALAVRRGALVEGHHDAMRSILSWLDRWQERTGRGSVWPYWVTRAELREGRLAPSAARRPSWCYGTAGVSRAQQLAALALGDTARQIEAEEAMVSSLTDPAQLKTTTDKGLCHGTAGLAHIAARMAADAHPATAVQLRATTTALLTTVCPAGIDPTDAAVAEVQGDAGPGFLDGAAGMALAIQAPATGVPPHSAWDACLLID